MALTFKKPRTGNINIAGTDFELREMVGERFLNYDDLWLECLKLIQSEPQTPEEIFAKNKALANYLYHYFSLILKGIDREWFDNTYSAKTVNEFLAARDLQKDLNLNDEVPSGNAESSPQKTE